jgi:NAD(P)-dependent dehydrogenase (short-subunit alcohol dehydrogenase family)
MKAALVNYVSQPPRSRSDGIRANAVSPGPIYTTAGLGTDPAEEAGLHEANQSGTRLAG